MTKQICSETGTSFEITDKDLEFYETMGVPPPAICPEERFRRRLIERNTRILYKRKCDATGKDIISPYHSDHPFPVYSTEAWWGDNWEELDYGQEYDFSRPFFEQFEELLHKVPHQATFVIADTMQNSEYTNCAGSCKNCYLIAEADYNEDVYHSNRVFHNKSLMDCSNMYESELCYEAINCINCFNVRFSEYCQNSSDCQFSKNCIGCRNCIGCMNQRQSEYMIFNEQYSKEEYEKKNTEMQLHTVEGIEALRRKADAFFASQPQRALQNENNEKSTGNHLYDSKNAVECFDCKDLEDCKYCTKVFSVKTSQDYTSWGDNSQLMYQCAACGDNCYNLTFCTTCTTNNRNLEYCAHSTGSSDSFGCVGLRKKQYCILNKKYSESHYKELRANIVKHMKSTGEWGEYFPKHLCPFAYNETHVMEYFPLTKEEAIAKGYKWKDAADDLPNITKTIRAGQLPSAIADIPFLPGRKADDILQWAITCKQSGRPFKIVKQELDFYRQQNLPVPHLHPDVRHDNRQKRRAGVHLYERICPKTGKTFVTSFAPDDASIVWSDEAYFAEIY